MPKKVSKDYRKTWFKAHPDKIVKKVVYGDTDRRVRRTTDCVQCCRCGKWCPTSDIKINGRVVIKGITIDHKIPERVGGTDEYLNLQPMCKSCNSSKGANASFLDVASAVGVGFTNPAALVRLGGSCLIRKAQDGLGMKYKRRR